MNRRTMMLAALALPTAAQAQTWPDRPIRFLQGFAPGGTTDILARLLAPELAAALGQPVVVENRPGAGGTLAAEALAQARPDGQTMMLLNNGFAASAAIFRRLPYDPVKDVVPATVVAAMALVLVVAPDAPWRTLEGLLSAARRTPGDLNVATVGVGSTQHFALESLSATAGVRFTHVPYRATPDALVALRQGQVQAVMETAAAVLGQVQANEARPLAVTTARRFPAWPQVPAVQEVSGLEGFLQATWYAIGFPAGTDAAVLWRLQAEVAKALAKPTVASRLEQLGLTPVASTPEAARTLVLDEIDRARRLVMSANIPQQ
jgi:tripartite-type tricarboxylate transporter receptor subunit TctC